MTALRVPDQDFESVDLASPLESVDLGDFDKPKWALMALDPSGKRQLLVRTLVSGISSDAMVFRELEGGGGNNERRLSVAKWNRKPHVAAKMERQDREVRVARMLAGSEHAGRFARLLAAQDMTGGYRESWWEYYNLGDMQDVHTSALRFCQPQPPLCLVFRCVAQCLEGIQCLNQLDVRHMDIHAGNIFFHMAEGATYPDAVIGDFGHSRFKGERPPKFSTAELGNMSPEEKEKHLSPPLNSDETFGTEDWSWRLRWDLHQFQLKIPEVLLENFSGTKARNELLFNFFNKRMAKMSAQDEKDRKLPEAERPPIQDLTLMIQDAWTLARLYAETATDKVALNQVRERLLKVLRPQDLEPRIFDDELKAREVFEKYIDAGMLRVVNLFDDDSIEAAAAELAAFKVKDSAYVSDQSETASSGTRDSSSGSGRQLSSTTSQASTRWCPTARGLASASAFKNGDASALDGLLEARDKAEGDHALIRAEHARRYRQGQGLGKLFRRS